MDQFYVRIYIQFQHMKFKFNSILMFYILENFPKIFDFPLHLFFAAFETANIFSHALPIRHFCEDRTLING